jgi:hypothetical protein
LRRSCEATTRTEREKSKERRASGKCGLRGSAEGDPAYGERFREVLEAIWRDYGRSCGKLLVPMIREMIVFLAGSKHPDYGIGEETRVLLLRVSPAAADRLLRKAKQAD